jgi:hypothetical protein
VNRTYLLLFSFFCSTATRAQSPPTIFPRPLSERIANYTIAVRLDPARKQLSGHETLIWRNTSRENVRELQFHLYLNAFKNSHSTFMRGSRAPDGQRGRWGWIEVHSLTTAEGEVLTRQMEFIHPDDDNMEDQTVFRVPLPHPVRPGRTITLLCDFTAQLPPVIARSGYAGEFFLVGQWFPKIGVYQNEKGWNCHQYHATTEFFADFGVYDVSITVPDRFLVGATGVRFAERTNPDSTKTLSYHAEDVHDFAWTASPEFIEVKDTWRHVALHFLLQPDHVSQAQRYISSCVAALEYFDHHVGLYPHPVLTIVDVPFSGLEAGGMEYPTFITVMTFWGLPENLRLPEQVAIHEFGHQYWQGMSANNEFEEAWLDEGVNQYFEIRIMNSTYGEKSSLLSLPGFSIGDGEYTRSGYTQMSNPRIAPPATPAWRFPGGTYGPLTYDKTAVALLTLERMIGTAAMDSILSAFFHRWRFRHPTGRDFVEAFGPSLREFFDQTIFGTAVCDFEVSAIRSTPAAFPASTGDGTGQGTDRPPEPSHGTGYNSTVLISRRGDMKLPVDVLVGFADGRQVREQWNGQSTSVEFAYRGSSPVRWACVDPDQKILLDVNITNNSRTVPSSTPVWKYAVKVFFWFQNLLHLAGLIG